MNTTVAIAWQTVQWPDVTDDATNYAVFLGDASTPSQVVTDITATVTYDDATAGQVFVIRPCDSGATTFGPAQTVFVGAGPMNNRCWFKTMIRRAISDRVEANIGQKTNISDDEIADYLNDALRKFATAFPREEFDTIPLDGQTRDYPLPTNYLSMNSVRYSRADTMFQMYLKNEPYKGGESTPTTWVGYPKLGIAQPAWSGRFWAGHFEVHQHNDGTQWLSLDFDPAGDGDNLYISYRAMYDFPIDDLEPLAVPIDDIEGLALYVQAKCWLQIEARDVYLSRFRSKEDGARRDDLPTEKMSTRLFNAWQQWLKERRTTRVRNIRLVRRT